MQLSWRDDGLEATAEEAVTGFAGYGYVRLTVCGKDGLQRAKEIAQKLVKELNEIVDAADAEEANQ